MIDKRQNLARISEAGQYMHKEAVEDKMKDTQDAANTKIFIASTFSL